MKHDAFKPTSMWKAVQEKEMDAFLQGVEWGGAHWKANHDNIVKRLRVFTNRPDLPVDRTEAYKEIARLQWMVSHYAKSNRILEEALERIKGWEHA